MLIRVISALLVLGMPVFAQYKSYSLWQPTNAAGVNYRWYVDDLTPPACVVQREVTDKTQEQPRIAITYRTWSRYRMILAGANMNLDRRKGPERTLVGCTFIEKVEVVPDPSIRSIISGSITGGR